MSVFKQRGYNDAFPSEIITWVYGESVPEWLSDRSKIIFIDGDGNVSLDLVNNTSGGYEIRDASGSSALVRTSSRSDYVCFGKDSKIIFSLTPTQLDLIYDKVSD